MLGIFGVFLLGLMGMLVVGCALTLGFTLLFEMFEMFGIFEMFGFSLWIFECNGELGI